MQEEINKLHEVLVRPVMNSRMLHRAAALMDAAIAVGMAVTTKQPANMVAVKLTDMRQEYVKLIATNPDYSYVTDKLDKTAIEQAFAAAMKVVRTINVAKPKAIKPKAKRKPKRA